MWNCYHIIINAKSLAVGHTERIIDIKGYPDNAIMHGSYKKNFEEGGILSRTCRDTGIPYTKSLSLPYPETEVWRNVLCKLGLFTYQIHRMWILRTTLIIFIETSKTFLETKVG